MMPKLQIHTVHRKCAIPHSTIKNNRNIIECGNNNNNMKIYNTQ